MGHKPVLDSFILFHLCVKIFYPHSIIDSCCRSLKLTHMLNSEMMCYRALKSLATMLFSSWLFKSIPTMPALGITHFSICSNTLYSMLSFGWGSQYCSWYLFVCVWSSLCSLKVNFHFFISLMQVPCHQFFCT